MASVALQNVCKKYGNVTAVNDLSLDIRDKEFMVLVGPSGCGKTTALRMVAGLEEITDGQISIGDRVVNDVEPRDRDIAMVFQNYALYPHMSVYENMAFGLFLRMPGPLWKLTHMQESRERRSQIDKRVREVAELIGIEQLLARKPAQLSGGQRQRVALGRAIVREPQVFLMDEPLSNLDAKLRVQTRAELIKLHRRLGITTIYVTHDQVEAMTMGDRIAVMKDGVLQQCDSPLALYEHPVNMFVAGFIGTPSMNFIEATLNKEAAGYFVDAGSFKLAAPPLPDAQVTSHLNKKVMVGIRPGDLFDKNLKNPIEPTDSNTIRTQVDVVEPMGDLSTVYLNIGTHQMIATLDGETKAKDGEALDVVVDISKNSALRS